MKTQVIGIVGGVASGKSFVAKMFHKLGAGLLDADAAGHEVLRLEEVKAAARARWGEEVFGSGGEIDRKRMAALVFAPGGEGELAYLESLTHPLIAKLLEQQLYVLNRSGVPVAILDAPVLLKAGWDRFCDRIVYVDSPRELRLARAATRGWSQAEFARREAAQESLDAKRSLADVVIDNSGSAESTEAQVASVWQSLVHASR